MLSSKFSKNLEFISENPEFITDKLSKMSRILSSYILGMKKIEKEIETADSDTLKRYVHSLVLSTTNLNENLYIVNLIVMMFLSGDSFKEDSKIYIENIVKILESQEGEHDIQGDVREEKTEEIKKEVKEIEEVREEVKEVKEDIVDNIKEEKIEIKSVEIPKSETVIEVVSEEEKEKQEPIEVPAVKIRKKRGRKKNLN